jgi:hypothetical protein
VTADGIEHGRVVHAEAFASEFGPEASVEHDRVAPFEIVDRHGSRRALGEEAFDAKEPREIVQQAGQSGSRRIFAVALG